MKTEKKIYDLLPDDDTLFYLTMQAGALKAIELLDGAKALERAMAGAVYFIENTGGVGRAIVDAAVGSALEAADLRPKKFKDRDKCVAMLTMLDIQTVMINSYLQRRGIAEFHAGHLSENLLRERMRHYGFPPEPESRF